MADLDSPWRLQQKQETRSGAARGYANALHAVYAVEPLPPNLKRLLDRLEKNSAAAEQQEGAFQLAQW